jgi:nitroimidazol reductase NimA-like FMN-containing flavoprotein (pyridoxamine 5'-phosphate oxidase superfamily)
MEPLISRPHFPDGYLEDPKRLLDWSSVDEALRSAIHYWLCSITPQHKPHAVPKWGVWVEQCFYFDGSPETKHARNIQQNPAVVVHLESGEQPVIVNGRCRAVDRPEPELAGALAAAYREKYAALGYAPQANQWENGGLFVVVPQTVLAWTQFTEDPTKFTFPKSQPR